MPGFVVSARREELQQFSLQHAEDTERQRHIGDDSREPRPNARVKAHGTRLDHDLPAAVEEPIVLARLNTLQSGLYDVDRIIGHDGAKSCETARY